MANQSTLSVVGPIGILVNIIFAYFILQEKITYIEIIGLALFLPGIIFTLYFASMHNNLYNQAEFNKLFYQPLPLMFLFGHIIILTILTAVSFCILKENPTTERSTDQEDVEMYNTHSIVESTRKDKLLETVHGDSSSLDTHPSKLFKNSKWKLLPLLVFPYTGAFYAGVLGGIIRISFGFLFTEPPAGYSSNFDNFLPKFYIVLIPVFAVLSYYYFNLGLKYYDSIYMAPLI